VRLVSVSFTLIGNSLHIAHMLGHIFFILLAGLGAYYYSYHITMCFLSPPPPLPDLLTLIILIILIDPEGIDIHHIHTYIITPVI